MNTKTKAFTFAKLMRSIILVFQIYVFFLIVTSASADSTEGSYVTEELKRLDVCESEFLDSSDIDKLPAGFSVGDLYEKWGVSPVNEDSTIVYPTEIEGMSYFVFTNYITDKVEKKDLVAAKVESIFLVGNGYVTHVWGSHLPSVDRVRLYSEKEIETKVNPLELKLKKRIKTSNFESFSQAERLSLAEIYKIWGFSSIYNPPIFRYESVLDGFYYYVVINPEQIEYYLRKDYGNVEVLSIYLSGGLSEKRVWGRLYDANTKKFLADPEWP